MFKIVSKLLLHYLSKGFKSYSPGKCMSTYTNIELLLINILFIGNDFTFYQNYDQVNKHYTFVFD